MANREIQHEAGAMIGAIQLCTRCGIVLSDYRGAYSLEKQEAPQGFDLGSVYVVGNRMSAFPDSPDFIPCTERHDA